jgi:PAS domain S-box-containing protein
MENSYVGEGYLKGPLSELGKRLPGVEEIQKYFKLLEFNVNELNDLINTFREQLKEGCMLLQDGKIFWANKAAGDISGYKQDELTGKPIVEMTVPDMRDKLTGRIKMLQVEGSLASPEEWPLLKADRTVAYVNVFAYRVKFLNNLAVLMFFYDVTEAKRIAEDRKMRAEMMDAINDGVFLMELSGPIIYANEAFCAMAGYSREEVLNKNILDVVAPEVRKRYDIRIKQFSTHKEARFTTMALSRDGKRINVEVRGKIIMHEGKQRVLGVARAIRTDKEPDIESTGLQAN